MRLRIDGKPVELEAKIYVMMNKPRGGGDDSIGRKGPGRLCTKY